MDPFTLMIDGSPSLNTVPHRDALRHNPQLLERTVPSSPSASQKLLSAKSPGGGGLAGSDALFRVHVVGTRRFRSPTRDSLISRPGVLMWRR
jgi:hypothetical protein